MTSKAQSRLKVVLYILVLLLAELVQTSVFGTLKLGVIPCVMPVAVACISVCEGAENGCVFGLLGGCLWAWSDQTGYYGVWCILALTAAGVLAGLITERVLLKGLKTALVLSGGALLLTEGLYAVTSAFSGRIPPSALITTFLPGALIALILCLGFFPLTDRISRIGGLHG